MKHKQHGFTIVELLIVIIVVAILAALSYVGYTNIQNRAYDGVVKQDLDSFRKSLEATKIDLGRYPYGNEFSTDLKLSKSAYRTTANHINYITNPEGTIYAFAVISKSGRSFRVTDKGTIDEVSAANAAATAESIGLEWAHPNPRHQGYTAAGGWTNSWSLVN